MKWALLASWFLLAVAIYTVIDQERRFISLLNFTANIAAQHRALQRQIDKCERDLLRST